jgi:hypothetical protein
MHQDIIRSLHLKPVHLAIYTLTAAMLVLPSSGHLSIEKNIAIATREIPMFSDSAFAPVSAVGDNVYVTWWTNKSTGNWDIFLIRSTDNGKTFGNVTKLTEGNGTSFDARLDASGDNVYVSWINNKSGSNQIYFKASNDRGRTFGNEIMIDSKISKGEIIQPMPRIDNAATMVSAGNNVYIIWHEDVNRTGHPEILFRTSNDGGATFENIVNLSNSPDGRSDNPAISEEGRDVFITFWDDKSGERNPYFIASNDGGIHFGNLIKLNATAG